MKAKPSSEDPRSKAAGSPNPGESVFILIGKVQRPHGVDGDLLVHSISEAPERFSPGTTVWIGESHQPYTIQSRRFTDRSQILHFRGLSSPEDASVLNNQLVYTQQSLLPPLPEGEFYHFQLIGLTVEDETGAKIGTLREVLTTGANDVYLVSDETGKEILIPAIESVVLNTDLEQKKMVIRPQEWI